MPPLPATVESMASTQEAIATTAPADPAVPALAVHRHSPRPCVNQALVDELATLRAWRFLQYGSMCLEALARLRRIRR